MTGDLVVPTPDVRVLAPCCDGWCLPMLVQYADEPGAWWLVCAECDGGHRYAEVDRWWERRTDAGWVAVAQPDLAALLGGLS